MVLSSRSTLPNRRERTHPLPVSTAIWCDTVLSSHIRMNATLTLERSMVLGLGWSGRSGWTGRRANLGAHAQLDIRPESGATRPLVFGFVDLTTRRGIIEKYTIICITSSPPTCQLIAVYTRRAGCSPLIDWVGIDWLIDGSTTVRAVQPSSSDRGTEACLKSVGISTDCIK